jgi:NTE family protein
MGTMNFTRERLGEISSIRRMLDHGYGIIGQRYYGDVNIVGSYGLRHYTYMLQNPTEKLFKLLQQEGERATWPKISSIATHARVGKTLEHCRNTLDQQRISRLQKLLPQTEEVKKLLEVEVCRHHIAQI